MSSMIELEDRLMFAILLAPLGMIVCLFRSI